MNDFRSNKGTRRAAGVLFLGGVALVATIATAAAFNGRDGDAGVSPTPAVPSAAPVVTPAPSEMPEPTAAPVVTPAPTEAPVVTPEPSEAPAVTPEPTDGGGDAMPIKVDLANATGNDVYVDIVDASGRLVDAVSGTPGDGMSVEPYTLHVENVDERTLRLTWVDFPIDNALALYIIDDEAGLHFVLVQPEPANGSDAVGFDRELLLTFDGAVSAGDIEPILQGGLDTIGE